MKATVIYHSADYDGIFCREVARKFLGDEGVTYIGWNYGDPKIPFPEEGEVYVLDLNPECLADNLKIEGRIYDRLIWIDHHKTALEQWPAGILGTRIDGVAACRLTWQFFAACEERLQDARYLGWPPKSAYVNREVNEPLAVRLAGEYDIWDKRDPRAETFQFGMRVCEKTVPNLWADLLQDGPNAENTALFVVGQGMVVQTYQQEQDASLVKHRSFELKWEGLNFLCLNTARCNSLTFAAAVKPEHDALLGFYWDGGKWKVSLYGAPHRPDLDLSAIAKKFGGGGHRQACGFTCHVRPWTLGEMDFPAAQREMADALYTEYCALVGGRAFNGDPLPSWAEFSSDPKKQKQVEAWLGVGSRALQA